jgi:hypothetical protein
MAKALVKYAGGYWEWNEQFWIEAATIALEELFKCKNF